ncbi:MAG: ABC transporter permease [Azospirillaceae bacterium]
MTATVGSAAGAGRRLPRIPVPAALILGGVLAWAVTMVAAGQPGQISVDGFVSILQRATALGFVAIGQTFAILVGSIDLSVANLVSVAAVMASFIMQGDPAMIVPAVVAVLAIGAAVGLANGLIVTQLGVNPLIATLGTGLILQGVLSTSFQNFAGAVPEAFQVFAYGQIGPFPIGVLTMLGMAAVAGLTLKYTVFGARIYAVGGNRDGARLAGIKTTRVVIQAHMLCSLGAAMTGLYLASRLRSGAPWVGRDGVYDLESIAVVVIGGTILAGGRGGVAGTIAGVIVFAFIDAIFNTIGIDAYLKQVLRGAIIIAAVAAYAYRMKGHVA